jgi:hypothetical protein
MKLLALATITLASVSAFAAGKSNTEYYYQPSAGMSAVTATYKMDIMPGKTESGGVETDSKQEMSDIYLNYAYGLNDNNALGAELFFGSNKWTSGTTTHTANGMGDLHLFYKGFTDMWHYGADLGIATEKVKLDSTTSLRDNRSTGGMSLKLNGGVLMSSGALNYGADLSYVLAFERSVDSTPEVKISGGDVLKIAPYLEYNWGMGFVGAELSYNTVSDLTFKANGGESKTKVGSFTGLLAYGTFDFNDTFTGILGLGMNMHSDVTQANGDKDKAFTETIASLGVRATF